MLKRTLRRYLKWPNILALPFVLAASLLIAAILIFCGILLLIFKVFPAKLNKLFGIKEKIRIKDNMTVILNTGGKKCIKH